MDRFFVISNITKDPGLKAAKAIQDHLARKGKRCLYQNQIMAAPGTGFTYTDERWVPEDTECVLVLGGDGTLIQAARDLAHRQIPMFGINMGTLGYLTEVDCASAAGALDKIMNDQYYVEDRMMLKGEIIRENGDSVKDRALNDIVITRKDSAKVVRFRVYVNGEFLSHYTADGMIISTPTGSTAYNLSAGGPLVEPNASIILITPISPHTLVNRTIVLPADARVTIRASDRSDEKSGRCLASFDGSEGGILEPGEQIEIGRSSYTTKILRTSKVSFLEILRKKLSD